jgi:hypothetical protein
VPGIERLVVLHLESLQDKPHVPVVQRVKKVWNLPSNLLELLTVMRDRPSKRNWLGIKNLLNCLPVLLAKRLKRHHALRHLKERSNGRTRRKHPTRHARHCPSAIKGFGKQTTPESRSQYARKEMAALFRGGAEAEAQAKMGAFERDQEKIRKEAEAESELAVELALKAKN